MVRAAVKLRLIRGWREAAALVKQKEMTCTPGLMLIEHLQPFQGSVAKSSFLLSIFSVGLSELSGQNRLCCFPSKFSLTILSMFGRFWRCSEMQMVLSSIKEIMQWSQWCVGNMSMPDDGT